MLQRNFCYLFPLPLELMSVTLGPQRKRIKGSTFQVRRYITLPFFHLCDFLSVQRKLKGQDSCCRVADGLCFLEVGLNSFCPVFEGMTRSSMGGNICHLFCFNGTSVPGNRMARLSFRQFCNWLKLHSEFLTFCPCHVPLGIFICFSISIIKDQHLYCCPSDNIKQKEMGWV